MKVLSLYPFLLLSVLLITGCAAEDDRDAPEPRPTPGQRSTPRSPATTEPPTQERDEIVVLVLGNSLAAGYGLDARQAFPALLQQKVDSLGWNVEIVNAGESGSTTAGGLSRIDWLLRREIDVLLIELGGNDGLRGISPEVTKKNLAGIIRRARARYPQVEIILAGMQMPPNLGPTYTERFRAIYPELAEEQDVLLIPFLLEGVGGVPSLNLPDGIHPTAEGQRIVAETVWQTLRPVLESMQQPV